MLRVLLYGKAPFGSPTRSLNSTYSNTIFDLRFTSFTSPRHDGLMHEELYEEPPDTVRPRCGRCACGVPIFPTVYRWGRLALGSWGTPVHNTAMKRRRHRERVLHIQYTYSGPRPSLRSHRHGAISGPSLLIGCRALGGAREMGREPAVHTGPHTAFTLLSHRRSRPERSPHNPTDHKTFEGGSEAAAPPIPHRPQRMEVLVGRRDSKQWPTTHSHSTGRAAFASARITDVATYRPHEASAIWRRTA